MRAAIRGVMAVILSPGVFVLGGQRQGRLGQSRAAKRRLRDRIIEEWEATLLIDEAQGFSRQIKSSIKFSRA